MKIEALHIENFKALANLDIQADRGIVILGGKNGAGKTSALDAIQLALCGKSTMPQTPIREGSDKATIMVDLGDVKVARTITRKADGTLGGSLTVTTRDGMKPGAAQTWLNQRIGDLSMDPLAFMQADAKARATQLRKFTGVDTADLDRRRAVIETERRDIGRDGAAEKARLDGMPYHEDAPEGLLSFTQILPAVVSAAAIADELASARKALDAFNTAHAAAKSAAAQERAASSAVADAHEKIARLKAELEAAKSKIQPLFESQEALRQVADEAVAAMRAANEATIDEAPILARLAEVDETNARARAEADAINAEDRAEVEAGNARREANYARVSQALRTDALRDAYAAKTADLAAIDAARVAMLAAATFPVPGLGFDSAGGVTLSGLPLDQASGAQKMRVSMAMALAANPTIRVVLIRDASLLDEDSMAIVAEMAAAADAQVWLERVGSADPGAVIITDGSN